MKLFTNRRNWVLSHFLHPTHNGPKSNALSGNSPWLGVHLQGTNLSLFNRPRAAYIQICLSNIRDKKLAWLLPR